MGKQRVQIKTTENRISHKNTLRGKLQTMGANKELYLLLVPGVLYFLIFRFIPLYGSIIAFQNYSPYLGINGSEWVGFDHFKFFFGNPDFFRLLKNTLILSILNLVFFFPLPIIVALLINEVRSSLYKRLVQSILYIPHFISMVIVASITYVFFTTNGGIVNELLSIMGGEPIAFLTEPGWFRPMIIGQVIWKETGWGTIIFLAAIAGIDPALYEAALIDGAGRFKRIWYITFPLMKTTIVVLLILRLGRVLDTGFEQIFLMLNAINRNIGEVFDTYVYLIGITQGSYSYSTAVGLFKSIVGLILVIGANKLAKRTGEAALY